MMIRTRSTLAVAEVMLSNPSGRYYGYDLQRVTGVRAGTLYPLLVRWLNRGLLTDAWQDPQDMGARQHLPRRYYTLTDKGRAKLGVLVHRGKVAGNGPH